MWCYIVCALDLFFDEEELKQTDAGSSLVEFFIIFINYVSSQRMLIVLELFYITFLKNRQKHMNILGNFDVIYYFTVHTYSNYHSYSNRLFKITIFK